MCILKQRDYGKIALASAAVFAVAYSFLYGLWRLPFADIGFLRMSEIGVADIIYLVLVSALAGSLISLLKYKMDARHGGGRIAGAGGMLAGVVSTICPACQGITVVAMGSSVAAVSLGWLIPYLWILQIASVFILALSFYLVSDNIHTNICISCKPAKNAKAGKAEAKAGSTGGILSHLSLSATSAQNMQSPESFLLRSSFALAALVVLAALIMLNQFFVFTAFASAGGDSSGPITLKPGFDYGPKITLKPMPLAVGENPIIAGYRTKVKPLPTISELQMQQPSGDVAQDLVNNIIPRGMPWYGSEAGVSFDDPITAQNLWNKARGIQLDAPQEERWQRIVNSFTCDYCCGSPQNPTIITRCGCAHAQAAQGMARWFIKYYGDKYSDEEIYGEMARWYALWYPGPTVKRIVSELQAA